MRSKIILKKKGGVSFLRKTFSSAFFDLGWFVLPFSSCSSLMTSSLLQLCVISLFFRIPPFESSFCLIIFNGNFALFLLIVIALLLGKLL